jgi:hypothetical protein
MDVYPFGEKFFGALTTAQVPSRTPRPLVLCTA